MKDTFTGCNISFSFSFSRCRHSCYSTQSYDQRFLDFPALIFILSLKFIYFFHLQWISNSFRGHLVTFPSFTTFDRSQNIFMPFVRTSLSPKIHFHSQTKSWVKTLFYKQRFIKHCVVKLYVCFPSRFSYKNSVNCIHVVRFPNSTNLESQVKVCLILTSNAIRILAGLIVLLLVLVLVVTGYFPRKYSWNYHITRLCNGRIRIIF